MSVIVRRAVAADAEAMATLLNEIIAIGGTTAYETPYSPEAMEAEYVTSEGLICCFVAEQDGQVLGFQGLLHPYKHDPMPEGWGTIATFADVRSTGKGIGRKLFNATCAAARELGFTTIDATIRADNESGLGFYERMGFRDYDRIVGVPLKSGDLVDRVRKRFDL